MADKNSSGAAGRAPAADRPDMIRNVVLVGPSGSGKTTLVEQLLVAAGTLARPGRVEDGTTVTDFDEAELRQQRSVGLALAPLEVDGVKVNLVDTPGYADFVGDLRAGSARRRRRAVRRLRGRRRRRHHPAAVGGVRGRRDAPRRRRSPSSTRSAPTSTTSWPICQRVFGDGVLPLYLPMHADDGTVGGV